VLENLGLLPRKLGHPPLFPSPPRRKSLKPLDPCSGTLPATLNVSMLTYLGSPQLPSDDKRWKIVEATARRHGREPNALIETLHTVQEAFGYLDDIALKFVAMTLRVPLSLVYGAATFYHYFTLKPKGKHTCVVCTGTACYIKGAAGLLAAIEKTYGVKPGETTPDDQLSVLTARCLGSCGLAPAVVMDGAVLGKVGPEQMLARIEKGIRHDH
jgi:bidirectional [NiFe] hydrogenase diaphorase subunit